jgi:Meiotically Up-regulated Gene 113 (MUG113) protein
MDKQYILDEIRRTAVANGGIPLGRLRFLRETGIRESDWSGRHWVKWGDAIRDAGFEPNSLQSARDTEQLLQQLVSLVRELGRFPLNNELRMKAATDPHFPSHNTWSNRFGNKALLAKRLVEYCSTRADLADVATFCTPIAQSVKAKSAHAEKDTQPVLGSVYLIRSGKYHKIGRSNAVGRREYELAIQLPERAQKVHEIRTDDPVGIEAYWHNRFAGKRKNGEWFELAAADVSAFRRRKFM